MCISLCSKRWVTFGSMSTTLRAWCVYFWTFLPDFFAEPPSALSCLCRDVRWGSLGSRWVTQGQHGPKVTPLLSWLCGSVFVSSDQTLQFLVVWVLQVTLGHFPVGCHVPLTKEQLLSGHFRADWRLSSLHKATPELCQRDHRVLGHLPD